MNQLIRYLTIAAMALTFLFSYSLLELVGWKSLGDASTITKVHPSTYLFTLAALIGLVSQSRRYREALTSPPLLLFLFAALVLTARAVMITLAGTTQGELSTALVTWVSPAMMMICYLSLDRATLDKIGIALRIFFVANSLTGLTEAILRIHFIPDLDMFAEFDSRSSGLCGHPLFASLLTGLIIVYLLSTRKQDRYFWIRIVELAIHAPAMFAFGGRAAMVFAPLVVAVSLFLNFSGKDEAKPTILQRVLPLVMIAAGIALIMVPIPFVDTMLERFTNDQGSAETRNSAFKILASLDPGQLMVGINADRRLILQTFYHSLAGIEISWISMIVSYGLIATIPMMVALPLLLFSTARQLDRSAFYMTVFFLLVTAASLSIGTKTLMVSQLLIMMLTLSARTPTRRQAGQRADDANQLFDVLRERQAPRTGRTPPRGA